MRFAAINAMLCSVLLIAGCENTSKQATAPNGAAAADSAANLPRDAVGDEPQETPRTSGGVPSGISTGVSNQVPSADARKAALLKRLHPYFLALLGDAYARMRQENLEALMTEQPADDWIVEFDGPSTKEWVDAIRATGAAVLGGLTRDSILVRNLDFEVVCRQPHVVGVTRFYSLYKLSREMLPLVGVNTDVTIDVGGEGDLNALRVEIRTFGAVQGTSFSGNGLVLKTEGIHIIALARLVTVRWIEQHQPIVLD